MENLEKSWDFQIDISRPGKVCGRKKNVIPKVLEKSWKFVIFTFYVEFELINMFLKERRKKYKQAYTH